MNRFAGYTREVPRGFWAMLRFAKDGKPKPIKGEGGVPKVFRTELEAQRAVTKHLLDYFNVDYLRHGERASAGKSEAEKMFGCIIKNGRKIDIERKGAGV